MWGAGHGMLGVALAGVFERDRGVLVVVGETAAALSGLHEALPPVLEPDLHRTRGHAKPLCQLLPLVKAEEIVLLERCDELLLLRCGNLVALELGRDLGLAAGPRRERARRLPLKGEGLHAEPTRATAVDAQGSSPLRGYLGKVRPPSSVLEFPRTVTPTSSTLGLRPSPSSLTLYTQPSFATRSHSRTHV